MPNCLWRSAISRTATQEGWLYLAVLLDAHSRQVVDWAMADHLRTELAAGALTVALQRRRPATGTGHHRSAAAGTPPMLYQRVLAGFLSYSMSRAGECLDNAVAEHFFATLKARSPIRRIS